MIDFAKLYCTVLFSKNSKLLFSSLLPNIVYNTNEDITRIQYFLNNNQVWKNVDSPKDGLPNVISPMMVHLL